MGSSGQSSHVDLGVQFLVLLGTTEVHFGCKKPADWTKESPSGCKELAVWADLKTVRLGAEILLY